MGTARYEKADCYVYFITDDHCHIKIGVAQNIKSRLTGLQTANPHKLRVLALIHFDTNEAAYGCENALHQKFNDYVLTGEWFQANPVIEFLNSENDLTIYSDDCSYTFHGFRDVFEEYDELRKVLAGRDEFNPYAWFKLLYSRPETSQLKESYG